MLLLIILAVLAIIVIIPPVVIFYQGIKTTKSAGFSEDRRLSGLYQLFCGLPTVLFLVLLTIVFIGRKLGLFIDQPEIYSGAIIIGLVIDAAVVVLLLIKGIFNWCREREDAYCYREGQRDIFYAIYHLGAFLLFFLLINLCLSTSEFRQLVALMI